MYGSFWSHALHSSTLPIPHLFITCLQRLLLMKTSLISSSKMDHSVRHCGLQFQYPISLPSFFLSGEDAHFDLLGCWRSQGLEVKASCQSFPLGSLSPNMSMLFFCQQLAWKWAGTQVCPVTEDVSWAYLKIFYSLLSKSPRNMACPILASWLLVIL